MVCPFTKKEIVDFSVWMRIEPKKRNINPDDLKFLVFKETFGEIVEKEHIYDSYITKQYSLPDFKQNFKLDYEHTQFLLRYHEIPMRGHRESVKQPRKLEKTRRSCLEKYGVKNVSQDKEIKQKKKETFLKNYGVDNIWKAKVFWDSLNDFYLKKHKLNRKDYLKKASQKIWAAKTLEEREKWLDESIRSEKAIQNRIRTKGYNSSKGESILANIFILLNVNFIQQFCLKEGKFRRIYDICLPDCKLIIEFNGNYWHANPDIYDADDLMRYKFGEVKAKDIWEKDLNKKKMAERAGYSLIYIWEDEIARKTEPELLQLVKNKLSNYEVC